MLDNFIGLILRPGTQRQTPLINVIWIIMQDIKYNSLQEGYKLENIFMAGLVSDIPGQRGEGRHTEK